MFEWGVKPQPSPKQCLVLDIDETLVHTYVDGEALPDNLRDAPEIKANYYEVVTKEGRYWGIKRPYLCEFLDFAQEHFAEVAFWSAGKETYVNEVVRAMNCSKAPTFVLNYDHCDQVHDEYTSREGVVSYTQRLWKPLELVFDAYPQFNRYNTWVLDDRRDYAAENLLNWLEIPPFRPSLKKLMAVDDDYLWRLMQWFQRPEVKHSRNVLEVNKQWFRR